MDTSASLRNPEIVTTPETVKALAKFDLEGLVRAFTDAQREKQEYVLDTETGTVHFVPLRLLKEAQAETLVVEKLAEAEREKGRIALAFIDDLTGRYELVPFVDEELIGEWREEFLVETGLSEIKPENQLAWETFRLERIYSEIELWLDETGILEESESWGDETGGGDEDEEDEADGETTEDNAGDDDEI
jgi:hypothetical protein